VANSRTAVRPGGAAPPAASIPPGYDPQHVPSPEHLGACGQSAGSSVYEGPPPGYYWPVVANSARGAAVECPT
jgi:hypothetical protein